MANFIIMDLRDFEVICGMNWLTEHYAFIDCPEKNVIFKISNRRTFYFQEIRSQPTTTSRATQTLNFEILECQGYLVSIQEIEKKKEPKIDDILVVRDYPKVFLENFQDCCPVKNWILV